MFRLTERIIMYAAAAAMLCIESLRVWALARTHLNHVNSNCLFDCLVFLKKITN